MRTKYLLLLSFVILGACKEQVNQPDDIGYDFYPLSIGDFRIYDVTEIVYEISGYDTLKYQLKETIIDSIQNIEETSFIVQREKKPEGQTMWQLDSSWSVRKNDHYVVAAENGSIKIKLVFPVEIGKRWDANASNISEEVSYEYEEAETDQQITVVIQNIEANLVEQDQRFDTYEKHIGLIRKNYLTLNFCTLSCDSAGQINSGRYLYQELVDYYVE